MVIWLTLPMVLAGCITARLHAAPTVTAKGDAGFDGVATIGLAKPLDHEHGVFFSGNFGYSRTPGEKGGSTLYDMLGVDFLSEERGDWGAWRLGFRAGARIGFAEETSAPGSFGVRAAIFPWTTRHTSECSEKGWTDLWCGETNYRNIGLEVGVDALFGGDEPGVVDGLMFIVGPTIEWNTLDD